MRITNNILVNNVKKYVQKNMGKLDDLNQKLASGKQFQKPSEAPIQTARSLKYTSFIKSNQQYENNLEEASNWLRTTEASLKDAGKILHRARELTVQGANGALSQSDRANIAEEIGELREELINIGNARLGDRYIFGGQQTQLEDEKQLFENDKLNNTYTYNGDNRAIMREIGSGNVMKVNITGEEAFTFERDGETEKVIDVLAELEEDLTGGSSEEAGEKLSLIDDSLNQVISKRAEMGAKINRLDMRQNRVKDEIVNLKELKSKNEDVDLAEVITDLKMEESVYRASLASGARSMQPTLVDFLR